ncbi:hypothetical protein [Flavobacterium psychrophilum]|uniref:hypothetical protein n=2 Tax=Flavobacterium psychrophilum TaxID=96345 RepID=UPI00141BDCB3|nr:hypothetical protein [Flavobacterium psychrophilum]
MKIAAELNAKKCGEKTAEIYLKLLNFRKWKLQNFTELNSKKCREKTAEIKSLSVEPNAKNSSKKQKFSADS